MGLFDFLKSKQSPDSLLVKLIEHNAHHIVQTEGKSRSEAIYLAICLLYDDLGKRPNGQEGRKALMLMLPVRYPDAFNDVMTYVAWSSGRIKLKPEHEAELVARHQ